ncbi:MAG: FAD-dependent oxidoreductase [Cyanobacteria bacterium P01_G01_bin.38]
MPADSVPANRDYDLVVIGAGSGGLAAAKQAAKQGKRVAIAEKEAIGGTCVNRGCIPTKLMIYAADFAKQQSLASDYGWVNPEGLFDWPTFKQAMDDHIQSLRQTQSDHLGDIDILRGQAEFVDAHTLRIGEQTVTTEYVLIAVGARPKMPDIPGIKHALTSRDIFRLETLPDSFLIAGGGYIGVEFSQVLRSFGCRVTLVDSSSQVLDRFDKDIQERVKQILVDDGIKVIDGARLEEIAKGTDTLVATLDDGQTIKAKQILCALGRTGNIDTLNLEAVAVATEKDKIVVDDQGRTNTPNIFAVGDCTDKMLLTPVARAEALAAVETMFSDHDAQVSYRWVPSAVFMHPEVAMVGLTERAAREQYNQIEVHCDTFSPLKYALASESLESLIKLVVDPSTQNILGVHLVAPRAADLVQALVPALKKGLTVTELEQTIGIHPSVGEEIFAL